MTVRACLFLTAITVAVGRLCAADHRPDLLPTVGSIERLDSRLDALVPPGASIEVLAMGFAWAEGPVWVPDDRGGLPAGSLLFSDIPHNRVHRWNAKDGVSVFLEPAGVTAAAATPPPRPPRPIAMSGPQTAPAPRTSARSTPAR